MEPQQHTMMVVDTGQLGNLNRTNKSQSGSFELEVLNSSQKSLRNSQNINNNTSNDIGTKQDTNNIESNKKTDEQTGNTNKDNMDEDDHDTILVDNRNFHHQTNDKSINQRYVSIGTEYAVDKTKSDDLYAGALITMVEYLLTEWTSEKMIDDAYDQNHQEINKEYDKYERWIVEPRVIRNKRCVKVETIVRLKTGFNAYKLYMNQRKYCDSNRIKIATKRTKDEYTKKIGFLSGAYVKLASPEVCIKEITTKMNLSDYVIDIAKEFTYEKKDRSKVLVVYAVESMATQINDTLCKMTSPRYLYCSYKNTDPNERETAMYRNDRHNINAKYESIYNANLEDKVWVESNRKYVTLEEILMSVKDKHDPLFLAAEEGSERIRKTINVVLNPKTKMKSKAWLVEECPRLAFKYERRIETSVDADDYEINKEYKERLKEFLRPTVTYAVQNDNRIGKNIKTYAQALGISKKQQEPKTQSKTKPNSKNEHVDSTLEIVIKRMEKQIEQLTAILNTFCEVIVKDENVKQELAKRIFEIKHNETSTSISDSIQKTKDTMDKKVDNETLEPKTLVTKIDRKVNDRKHLLQLPLNVTGDMKGVQWMRNNKKQKSKDNIEK